jgi:hypothetical protein
MHPSWNLTCDAIPVVPQVAVPTYGEWLDVYLTVLKPLPLPTGGLLGERRHCSPSLPPCLPSAKPWSLFQHQPCSACCRAFLIAQLACTPPRPAGSTYKPPAAGAAAASASDGSMTASIVFDQLVT